MKRLMWLGLLFLTVSWLFLLHIFTYPDISLGILFQIVGIILFIVAFKDFKCNNTEKKHIIFALLLSIVSTVSVPFPYNLGIIFMVAAFTCIILFAYIHTFNKFACVPIGMLLAGIILVIQAALFPIYTIISTRCHDLSALSPIFYGLTSLVGYKASTINGLLYIQTPHDVYQFTISLEKLGFFTMFMMTAGAIILLTIYSNRKKMFKYLGFFVIFSIFYLIIRFFMLILFYINFERLGVFWSPTSILLSFLPLSIFIMLLIPLDTSTVTIKNFRLLRRKKESVLVFFLMMLFTFSLVGSFSYSDPGSMKDGRVLIDELHSDWENTTRPMDKGWYGTMSVYNYYSLTEWLKHYYQVDINTNRTLSSDLLGDYDILIIKCPTNPFNKSEVDAVVNFVAEGGGLYLIGDHTNVFGMNYCLNQIADNFGIHFNFDSTYDYPTGNLSVYRSSILPHPIVQHVSEFSFLTSCTLNAPLQAENVIIGYGLLNRFGTYSTPYFFRETWNTPDVEVGYFLQTVALKYGKGRVVAFTDSTVFSNFAMFMDGYPNFTLGTMEYLNRENLFPYLNALFWIASLAAAAFSFYLLRRENRFKILLTFLVIGLFSFSIAAPTFTTLNEFYYPLPLPQTDFSRVCFVQSYSDFDITPQPSVTPLYKQFDTFFIWTQRVGFVPSVEETLKDAVAKGDVVVIINPVKTFSLEDKRLISRYLENGGNLILMDSVLNQDSTANQLLGFLYGDALKLQVVTSPHTLRIGNSTGGQNISILDPYLAIIGSGLTYSVLDDVNRTFVVVKEYGEGRVIVVVDSYSFSNAVMGGSFTVPDETQRAVYEAEYYILEKLVGGKKYVTLDES